MTEDRVVKCYGLRNKKTVKPARGSLFDCWLRETTCLQRLKGHDHFPQMDDCEESDLSLSMSNCGESLFPAWKEHDLTQYIDQVHAIADTLEEAQKFVDDYLKFVDAVQPDEDQSWLQSLRGIFCLHRPPPSFHWTMCMLLWIQAAASATFSKSMRSELL